MGKLFQKFQEAHLDLNVFVENLRETVPEACNLSERQKKIPPKKNAIFFVGESKKPPLVQAIPHHPLSSPPSDESK